MLDTPETFRPPPEAPIFEPTVAEFADPLIYIAKIKPIIEKVGICKVRPPAEWQPPFAVDVDTFRFTPRVQKINELEATTRVKLNFLDKLLKFWELQGVTVKIPTVDRKLLDFHKLHKTVAEEGGYDTVTRDRKWTKVASRMNLVNTPNKLNGGILKSHYDKFLYPFDLFAAGITVVPESSLSADDLPSDSSGTSSPVPNRGRKRKTEEFKTGVMKTYSKSPIKKEKVPEKEKSEPDIDYSANSELKKLQFFGAGPKAALPLQITKDENQQNTTPSEAQSQQQLPDALPPKKVEPTSQQDRPTENTEEKKPTEPRWKMRDRSSNWRASYVSGLQPSNSVYSNSPSSSARRSGSAGGPKLESDICKQCEQSTNESRMLVCGGCDDAFHMYCLVPPLADAPKGDWRCPKCVAKECNKPKEVYGFEQAKKAYSLPEFGEMADQFKADYFGMPVHMVPCSTVEREFWRLTTCLEEDVSVQYGADIHSLLMGSGFPTRDTKDLLPEDEEYINSRWNLNNLPVHERSILKYVTGDVSGMKVPWCYVGMVFSSFCWHIEDHWSYSINYHHWGEPKTWYGVPSSHAEALEQVMKSRAPELFEQSPDLLHHITTIMNPNYLMDQGIPIVRTNQCAGEFIITCPRAYHAGFNQGYNFAEAVNFCPADWLPFGRACLNNYKTVKRQCVFSHEELVCKMAADPDSMDIQLAAETHKELLAIVDHERKHRKKLLEMGVCYAEREAFELVPDDERQCTHCKTTCFLSAVTCPCKPNKIACIEHAAELCQCPGSEKCLRYRYTLDELPAMILRLRKRAESYEIWTQSVRNALATKCTNKLTLVELKQLSHEAKDKHYPDSSLLRNLVRSVQEADKCANLAAQLVHKKVRAQRRPDSRRPGSRLTLDELEQFHSQMAALPCIIKETALIHEFLERVTAFQSEAEACLAEEMPQSEKVSKLYEFGCTLDLELVEVPQLKQVLSRAEWLDQVKETLDTPDELALDAMRDLMEKGMNLAPHQAVEKAMTDMQELLNVSERWEEKAKICLQARPRHIMSTLEAIINEAKGIPAHLPNVTALKDALKKAREWNAKVELVQSGEHYPYLDLLESLVNKGRPIPVRLDLLPQVESQVTAAKSWRERTARTFLKKNSTYSLLEVLSPRGDVGMYPASKKRRKKENDIMDGEKPEGFRDPAQMVETFKKSEAAEVEAMRALRAKNMEKHRQDDVAEVKYCLCRKGPAGHMLQCELCKDWFHGQCVPLSKPSNIKSKNGQSAIVQAARENKFLCPLCLRSRRPRLETILSLLVSLQKLPVRLGEGEALQCLTERAMAWQDRARQALATDELASALAKLSVLSQRMVEQAAREKTEKIINAELQKAANNPDLQGHLHTVTQNAFNVSNNPTSTASATAAAVTALQPTTPVRNEPSEVVMETPTPEEESKPVVEMSEHAYSSVSKASAAPKSVTPPTPAASTVPSTTSQSTESPRKHPRKSPLIPRQMDAPVLELSDLARAQLEELMMEGDLLEVSLDETQHIWKILRACKGSAIEEKFMAFEDQELDFNKPLLIDTKREKKRKIKKENESDEKAEELNRKKKKRDALHRDKQKNITPVKKAQPSDKKKKKKPTKVQPQQSNEGTVESAKQGDHDDEPDEDCSATKCLKPVGDEVDWVQCDKCELWFHLTCVNLTKADVSENEDYICIVCKPPLITVRTKSMDSAAGGDQPEEVKKLPEVVRPALVDTEEIISVVSTPVPSAATSPEPMDSSGDGPKGCHRPASNTPQVEAMESTTPASNAACEQERTTPKQTNS